MAIEDVLKQLNEGDTVRVSYKPAVDLGSLSKRSFVGEYKKYDSKRDVAVFDRPVFDVAVIGIHVNWPIKTKDIQSLERLNPEKLY